MARVLCTSSSWDDVADGVHFLDAAAPKGLRLYAIGDVHGCARMLAEMHALIRGEIMRDRPADWRVIHLGDYVDRGPDSRGAVDLLARASRDDARFIALAGNHDLGLLDFLREPDPHGMFALNGGRETVRSYGVAHDPADPAAAIACRDALGAAMPEPHLRFLRGLTRSVAFGDFFFCHAGIRPGVALDAQSPDDLVWIRKVFHAHSGLHEKVIVHGHTPVSEPEVLSNRVNLDTGACFGGRLTAMAIEGDEKRLISVA